MDTPDSSSERNPSAEPADLSGVSISGQANVTAHDIIGRDKIIHGDVNTATIGENAQVGQIALGSNITQISGITAAEVVVLLDKIRTEYQSKPFDGHSPYIGLASFQERDADKFFGRERLTAELVTRVATSAASSARAVFVAGPSGSGKSSLVRAGLVPALKKGKVAGSEHWLYETLKPGRAPLEELARVVSSFANSPDAGDDLRAHALNDATRLYRWADIALKDDSQRRAVIVIDQFEEIFTQLAPDRENERVAFLNLLTHAATIENGRVLVIFTLRSDFVSNCASYPNLNALVNQQFIQVGAMMPDELVSAIARPAYQVGLRIDPALISQIVNDVRGEPGALPLMQFALQDLFEAEKSKGELTLDGYLARGGLRQALERHADAEFAKLDDAEKQLARSIFSGLIEIGRGREDTKRTALFRELVPAGADAACVQALVRKLADARLITTDEQDGKETVTLAHERLIDAWDWLRKLVDENRDAIALQNEIAQDAQEWQTHKRDEGYLYRGARLATAEEKLQQNQLVLSGLAQEFVETAIAAREDAKRKDVKRTRRLIIAFGSAAAIFAVLTVLTFFSNQRATVSEQVAQAASTRAIELRQTADKAATVALDAQGVARQESTRAIELRQTADKAATVAFDAQRDARRESTRAVEQKQIADVESTRASMENQRAQVALATAEASGQLAELLGKRARAEELAKIASDQFEKSHDLGILIAIEANKDPDGVTFNSEDTLRQLSSKDSMNPILEGHSGLVNDAEFSLDEQRIFTSSQDKTAREWDLLGEKVLELKGHTDIVHSVQLSFDGQKIVTASDDGTVRVWQSTSGNEVDVIPENGIPWPDKDKLWNARLAPDGKKIVISGDNGTAVVWDFPHFGDKHTLDGHTGIVYTAEFSADGTRIVTAGEDKTARLWDSTSGRELVSFPHVSKVWSAAFSPDGTKIVTASDGNKAFVWDISTSQIVFELEHSARGAVYSAEFSPDGRKIVTSGVDGEAHIWDAVNGKKLANLYGHLQTIYKARFSASGKKIVTASRDNTARVHLVELKDLIELSKEHIRRDLRCEERVLYLGEEIDCSSPTPTPTQ